MPNQYWPPMNTDKHGLKRIVLSGFIGVDRRRKMLLSHFFLTPLRVAAAGCAGQWPATPKRSPLPVYNGLRGTQMPTAHDSLLERITIDAEVRFGKPCIRGHRITVQEILEWLSGGASQQQVLADYPQLQPDDFLAVYAYAAGLRSEEHTSELQS